MPALPKSVTIWLALTIASVAVIACQNDEQKLEDFLERGRAAVAAEQHKEAVIEYRNVLQLDPQNKEAHWELAQAYVKIQKPKDAFWMLRETVRLDPSNAEARKQFAQFSLLARDFDEVLAQTEVLTAEGGDALSFGLRGDALFSTNRKDEAEAAYLRAAELAAESDEPTYILPLIQFLLRDGRADEARPWLDQLVEKDPSFRSYTLLARQLARDKDPEAEEAFRKALEVAEDEDKSSAYRNMAGYHYSRERVDEAIALLEDGVAKLDDNLELVYTLASLYASQGQPEKADALVQRAADEAGDDARPHLILSAYLSRKGDVEGALSAAEAGIAADPESEAAKLRKAELLVDLGYRENREDRVEAGRQVVDAVLAESPTNPQGLFVRAKLELAQLNPQAASESLRAALEGRPDWPQAHFVLGTALMLLGDQNGARGELARAVELDPAQLDARRSLARVHSALGEHEYAVEQARLYLRERPNDMATRILVAQGLVNLGKPQDALAELRSIDASERNADAWFALGRLELALGNVDTAREAFLAANAARPNNADVLRNLHLIDRRGGRLEESAARIEAAVAAEPKSSKLAQLLGLVEMARGDVQGAEAAFKKATELNPDDLTAYQQLATFYRATGRVDESIKTLERSLQEQPNSPRLHERVAILHEMNGDRAKAVASYEKAIELDPNLGEAKNNLAYLLADEKDGDLDRALDLAQEAKALLPDSPQAADTLGWVLYKRGIPSAAIGYLREAAAGLGLDEASAGVVHHHLALAYEANEQPDMAKQSAQRAIDSISKAMERAAASGRKAAEPEWLAEARAIVSRNS